MNKPRKYGWVVTLVLLAAIVWVVVQSRRGPDYASEIKQRLPSGCELVAAWRHQDWPNGAEPTYALCDDGSADRTFVMLIGDIRTTASISMDKVTRVDVNAWLLGDEMLTIQPNGDLVISGVDEPDAAMTIPPIP